MYDLDTIRKVINETCEKAKCVPIQNVKINSRLTRTLGRVLYTKGSQPRMEFSKLYLENSTDECVYQTILHECAHYIAWARTGSRHGHDLFFKQICAEIGCKEDKTTSHVEALRSDTELYRYTIYCPNCGCIGGQQRWSRSLEGIATHDTYCKKCKSHDLTYQKNW